MSNNNTYNNNYHYVLIYPSLGFMIYIVQLITL